MEPEQGQRPDTPVVLLFIRDVGLLSSLKFALSLDGYNVAESSGSGDPSAADVLVLDQGYHGDGIAFLEAMRSADCRVPAIHLATNPMPALRKRVSAAHALLVEKPLLSDDLVRALGHVTRTGEGRTMTETSISSATLPGDAISYKRTATFTEMSVPAALLGEHSTKAGAWGLIHVEQGELRYLVTDPRREPSERVLSPGTSPGVVEPTIIHRVELLGPVRFHVEFLRCDDERISDGDPHTAD